LGFSIGKFVYHAHHRETLTGGDDGEIVKSAWPLITPQYSRQARQYGMTLTWNF
jgi:hypothetical protein